MSTIVEIGYGKDFSTISSYRDWLNNNIKYQGEQKAKMFPQYLLKERGCKDDQVPKV